MWLLSALVYLTSVVVVNINVSHWCGCGQVMSREGDWYATYEDLPLKLQNQIRPAMFPPPPDVAESRHLDRW